MYKIFSNISTAGNISGASFYGDGSNLTGVTTDPAGSDTQIQFNDSGSFGGSSNVTWDDSQLTVNGNISGSNIFSSGGNLQTQITSNDNDIIALQATDKIGRAHV